MFILPFHTIFGLYVTSYDYNGSVIYLCYFFSHSFFSWVHYFGHLWVVCKVFGFVYAQASSLTTAATILSETDAKVKIKRVKKKIEEKKRKKNVRCLSVFGA